MSGWTGMNRLPQNRSHRPVVLAGFLMVVCASTATAQPVSIGPRIGLNLSAVLFDDPSAAAVNIRPGLHVGVSAALAFNRFLSAEASLLLGQYGYNARSAHPGNVELDYLDVPIVLRLRLPTRISPCLIAGLSAGYLVQGRMTGVAIVGETSLDDPLVGTDWRSSDYGVLAGLGIGLPAGTGRLEFDLVLSLGLRDIKEDILPPGPARRLSIRLSLGYLLPRRSR
jgi:hypothetical protein